MENQLPNLSFVLVLLLALSGSLMRSGRAGAVQESITVKDCKISCNKGSPKLLSGKWTCVDEKHAIVWTPEMINTKTKLSSSRSGCAGVLLCEGIYCGDVNDCGHCCGIGMAPFCMDNQCGCV